MIPKAEAESQPMPGTKTSIRVSTSAVGSRLVETTLLPPNLSALAGSRGQVPEEDIKI